MLTKEKTGDKTACTHTHQNYLQNSSTIDMVAQKYFR